jgi:hypothetical protein
MSLLIVVVVKKELARAAIFVGKRSNHSLVRFLFISSLFSSRRLFPTGAFHPFVKAGIGAFGAAQGHPRLDRIQRKGRPLPQPGRVDRSP